MQTALHSGAAFSFEGNPHSKTRLACAGNGKAVIRITPLPPPQ